MTRTLAATAGGLALLGAGFRAEADAVELLRLLVFGAAVGAIVATDLAEHRIPNWLVVPATLVCAALATIDTPRVRELLSGVALVIVMFALSILAPASLGMGDVKLGLLFVLGLGGLATGALILGLILAAAFGAALLLRYGRVAASRSLPLAPFFALGALLVIM